MRCVFFWDATIFVATLQDDYTFFWDAMCFFSGLIWSIFGSNFMLPKRRFYKSGQKIGRVFSMHLQPFLAQIEYSHAWKEPWKDTADLLFRLPKSSFGEHKHYKMITKDSRMRCDVLVSWDAAIFCSNFMHPNEDFGRPNKHFRVRFRNTFQRFVAQIRYSHLWKCFEMAL